MTAGNASVVPDAPFRWRFDAATAFQEIRIVSPSDQRGVWLAESTRDARKLRMTADAILSQYALTVGPEMPLLASGPSV